MRVLEDTFPTIGPDHHLMMVIGRRRRRGRRRRVYEVVSSC